MSKDFFDEEYDKVTEQREKEAQQTQQTNGSVEDWYNYGGTTVAQKSSKKPGCCAPCSAAEAPFRGTNSANTLRLWCKTCGRRA